MSDYTQQFLGVAGYAVDAGGDIRFLVAGLIQVALSLVSVIFLIIILYGGFLWMSAAGNEEQVKKAQAFIKTAVIGFAITLLALIITRFVAELVLRATAPTDTIYYE